MSAPLSELQYDLDAALRKVDSYRAGNTALLEALMDMVWQFIGTDDRNAVFSHHYIGAEEAAINVLIAAGMAAQVEPGANSYRLLWDALEARKPKRQTWAEAVEECITDPAEKVRLLALEDESIESIDPRAVDHLEQSPETGTFPHDA